MNENGYGATQTVSRIFSFTKIPRTTELFSDYLYQKERVLGFYQVDGWPHGSLCEYAGEVIARDFPRDLVADALTEENQRFGSPARTFENIELLRRPDTVAVVTGQQAGLFMGPLFAIYKAITAVKIAENLCAQGQPAVPVFWIASEDHDYEEVSHCHIVNNDGKLVEIRYAAGQPAGMPSIGDIKLSDDIEDQIKLLFASLPESEFVGALAQDLRAAYQSGVGFAEAYGRLLARFFQRYGVILLDPQHASLKRLAAQAYEPALRNCEKLARDLVEQSRALEAAGYHAQIHASLDMVPLFFSDNGQRSAIIRDGERFILKSTSRSLSLDELLEQMKAHPEHFSPSVVLRPIAQDLLLPTVAYIGGPSEVAYFAQLRPIYQFFQRKPPMIMARASLTLLQERFANILKKYNLEFEDVLAGQDGIMRKIVEGNLDTRITATFEETEKIFQEQLDSLRDLLINVEPTLAEAIKGSREKIFYQLNNLRTRFINNSAKREETTARHVEKALAVLYPNKNLQERELNIYYFLARYGYDFIDMLHHSIEPIADGHQLLDI
jgi:bacillithiol biosynthesis cysteine-adding enzyme BshC